MADKPQTIELSYFPGCSLATTARESNQSLVQACSLLGLKLIELEDWNCCGSSSAHSVDPQLALDLACRNLALAPPSRPLLIMCPSCFKNQRLALETLAADNQLRKAQERRLGREINPDLKIVHLLEAVHFLQMLSKIDPKTKAGRIKGSLKGLKAAAYYGCMLYQPPHLKRANPGYGSIEQTIRNLGGESLLWAGSKKCCGTFLAAARPDVVGPLVNQIMSDARSRGAECLVTACAMCQLNMEIRCTIYNPLPTLHFSEVLALALGSKDYEAWFKRHIVDPRPLLRQRGLIN